MMKNSNVDSMLPNENIVPFSSKVNMEDIQQDMSTLYMICSSCEDGVMIHYPNDMDLSSSHMNKKINKSRLVCATTCITCFAAMNADHNNAYDEISLANLLTTLSLNSRLIENTKPFRYAKMNHSSSGISILSNNDNTLCYVSCTTLYNMLNKDCYIESIKSGFPRPFKPGFV